LKHNPQFGHMAGFVDTCRHFSTYPHSASNELP
jgi:hypothetical protein